MQPGVQFDQADAEDDKVGHGVADQDGPEKVLRVFQEAMQHFRPPVPGPQPLADAKMIQGQHARFHAGKQEGKRRAEQQGQDGQ